MLTLSMDVSFVSDLQLSYTGTLRCPQGASTPSSKTYYFTDLYVPCHCIAGAENGAIQAGIAPYGWRPSICGDARLFGDVNVLERSVP